MDNGISFKNLNLTLKPHQPAHNCFAYYWNLQELFRHRSLSNSQGYFRL